MKVVNSEQMQEIDRRAEAAGVPVLELMENAGRAVCDHARKVLEIPEGRKVVVVCGKGNNGGDGLVAARHLKNWGTEVEALLAVKAVDLAGAPLENYDLAKSAGVKLTEEAGAETAALACAGADLVIDALLGTGIRGEVQGAAAEMIAAMNRSSKATLAVDIPSGVNADTGEIAGAAVWAQYTVTLGLPKPGVLLYPGAEHSGKVSVADIGFPPEVVDLVPTKIECLEAAEAAALLPIRSRQAHKGECGRVLVVAGSAGYSGAAALCAQGALRAGAGLVTLATPASLNPIMEVKLTEVICWALPETPTQSLSNIGTEEILKLAQESDAVVIGPGLSLDPETTSLVRRLVGKIAQPMVIDADGLGALAKDMGLLEGEHAPLVLTPHPGEMGRLLGRGTDEVQRTRPAVCRELAERISGVVVLKGAATLTAEAKGRLYINRTGNPGMATAGTGDVLSGMIGSLIAQGMAPFEAAGVGVFLHGMAGDLASEEKGEASLIASDLLEKIAAAILQSKAAEGRQTE